MLAIAAAVVENFKDFANAELGACKNLGLGNPEGLEVNHAYGVKSSGVDEWGTGECIKGAYTEDGQRPDKDLGTTLRPGWRNAVEEGDDKRSFGVPGVRTDIAPPRTRSVADHQNYGDEPGSFTVMCKFTRNPALACGFYSFSDRRLVMTDPSKYAVNGVDELDFNSP